MADQQELLRLAAQLPSAEFQNRVVKISDRELALALIFLVREDRVRFLSRLPSGKADRVSSELLLHRRIRIPWGKQREALDRLVEVLRTGKGGGVPRRGWIGRLS